MPSIDKKVDGDVADVAVVLQLLVEQELQSATYEPPPTPLLSSPIGSVVSWIGYEVATFLFSAIYTLGMGSPIGSGVRNIQLQWLATVPSPMTLGIVNGDVPW